MVHDVVLQTEMLSCELHSAQMVLGYGKLRRKNIRICLYRLRVVSSKVTTTQSGLVAKWFLPRTVDRKVISLSAVGSCSGSFGHSSIARNSE